MTRWFEHFFIIPPRWWRLHVRNWRTGQQRCKICGCRDKFNYHISDARWRLIVPEKYQNRVVCLACFDDFAAAKSLEYFRDIDMLTFSGARAGLGFLPAVVRGVHNNRNPHLVVASWAREASP